MKLLYFSATGASKNIPMMTERLDNERNGVPEKSKIFWGVKRGAQTLRERTVI